jgi:ribosome-associated heat shock protein Hsp15
MQVSPLRPFRPPVEMKRVVEGYLVGMETVRMDKWLWAARFFKTRALASKACELGRVKSGEIVAKAARDVRVGDRLSIKNEGGEFGVEVLGLSEVRGPAAVAQGLFRETPESQEARAKVEAERKAMFAVDVPFTEGRPSKKDRRLIHRFKGR